jgi:hypothetical protein
VRLVLQGFDKPGCKLASESMPMMEWGRVHVP